MRWPNKLGNLKQGDWTRLTAGPFIDLRRRPACRGGAAARSTPSYPIFPRSGQDAEDMHRFHQFPRPGVNGRAGDAPGVGLYQEHQDILPRHRRDLPPLARQGVRVVLRKFLPGEKDFSSLSAVEVQTEELP